VAPAQQRQRWGLRGRGLDRRRDIAGPERIDVVDVPARLWSGEGRRGGSPTNAGTDRRGTGHAVGKVRWDAGVHGQDFPPFAQTYGCISRRWLIFLCLSCLSSLSHACLPLARVLSSRSLSHSRALPFFLARSRPCSRSPACSLSLSLAISLSLARSRSGPSRACSLLSFSANFSLSLARDPFLSRSLSPSLSFSRVRARALSLSLYLSLSRSLSLSLSLSSQRRVRPLRRPCHVLRCIPSAIVPPLPPAIALRLVASAAPRRVSSRPRGVYTPPRLEQIGSIPATIYPRVRVQLPSCAGHGALRCNRSMRVAPCCNSS